MQQSDELTDNTIKLQQQNKTKTNTMPMSFLAWIWHSENLGAATAGIFNLSTSPSEEPSYKHSYYPGVTQREVQVP
jgi:hypothetical protein